MPLSVWISFVLATILILVVPGPTVIMVVTQAAAHGRRSVAPLVGGVLLGDFTAMTLSLLGLGALMSVSGGLFTALKWAGALYMGYLGVQLWRSSPEAVSSLSGEEDASSRSLARSSFIVTALNPKSIVFFVAFFPQFIQPHAPRFTQFLLLGITFISLAGLSAAMYAVFAGRLREFIQRGDVLKWINRLGGAAMVGTAVLAAAAP